MTLGLRWVGCSNTGPFPTLPETWWYHQKSRRLSCWLMGNWQINTCSNCGDCECWWEKVILGDGGKRLWHGKSRYARTSFSLPLEINMKSQHSLDSKLALSKSTSVVKAWSEGVEFCINREWKEVKMLHWSLVNVPEFLTSKNSHIRLAQVQ